MAQQSKGFQAFSAYFATAHNKVGKRLSRSTDKMLDPATLGMIFTFLTEAFRICFNRDGEQATIQRMKENGGLNAGQCYRALLRSGYMESETRKQRKTLCREMAVELTAGTGKVPADDLEAFLNDVRDTPTPVIASDDGDVGFWSVLLLIGLLFVGSNVQAADGGFWDMEADVRTIKTEVSQTSREVATLGERVARLENSARSTESMVTKLSQHLLPEQESPVCDPLPASVLDSIKIELAPVTPKAALDSELSALSESLAAISQELATLRAATATARSSTSPLPASLRPNTIPASPRPVSSVSSGILLNGRSIGDVNAYIRANPAGYVGVNGSLVLHLQQHGFSGNLNGLSRNQQQKLHDIAHARGYQARTIYHTAASQPAQSTGCANGQCARPMQSSGGYYKTGLFGLRTRWVSN